MSSDLHATIELIDRNPIVAHSLFKHRHPAATPHAHYEVIRQVHDPKIAKLLVMAFRGFAKSTIVEEAIVIMALLKKFRNCLIVAETEARAKDRLRSIKWELENNEALIAIFDYQEGEIWQESKIALKNGVFIQAHGQGQSLRGIKHLDARPDFCFVDDLEDKDSTKTPEARAALSNWFYASLLPALAPSARIRMAATPLDPEALAVKHSKSPDWKTAKYPVWFVNADGETEATWPDWFSLELAQAKRDELFRAGETQVWEREYMLNAVDPKSRVFLPDMFRCEPVVRTYQPVYAVYDPARTTNKSSASTGRVIASWSNNRLLVWECTAEMWKPDEIIEDMFRTEEVYQPVAIGVEEDGLNEFILQPLRHAQVAKGITLPLRPLKAPRGKLDFIRSLQPFFRAREIIFANDRHQFESAIGQFLSFPTGNMDAPNAMAYLPVIRPGVPIYEHFSPSEHVVSAMRPRSRGAVYLAINATGSATTGILVEHEDGVMRVLADWVKEGDAGMMLADLLQEARLFVGRAFTCYAPREHFTGHSQSGLRGAGRRAQIEIRRGGEVLEGRNELRSLMQKTSRGGPAFLVAAEATWTLRALTGGYARPVGKDFAQEGAYKVLCEGLEAFAATLRYGLNEEDSSGIHYERAGDGRLYHSARAT